MEAREGLTSPQFAYPARPWHLAAFRYIERGGRFLVIRNGVYTGKTNWASFAVFDLLTRRHRGSLAWWVAGINFQIGAMWDGSGKPGDGPGFAAAAKSVGARIQRSPYRVATFPAGMGGSRLMCVTAKNIDLIASFHPDVIVIDEADKIGEAAWDRLMGRFLNVKLVIALGTSEPNPSFDGIVESARRRTNGALLLEVDAYQAGIVPKAELDRLKGILPRRVFQRDVLNIRQRGQSAVFEGLEGISTWGDGRPVKALLPKQGERYVIGYDQAKAVDATFLTVYKPSTGQAVEMRRRERVEYHVQARELWDLSEAYGHADVIMDATGALAVLEIVYRERARRSRPGRLIPVWLGGANVKTRTKRQVVVVSKEGMIDRLAVAIANGDFKIPGGEYGEAYAIARSELERFEMRRRRGGLTWEYGAPDGEHDDSVTSMGLCLLESASRKMPVSFLEEASPYRRLTQEAIDSSMAGAPGFGS